MFRKRSIFGVLMTVLVILALTAGGFALFRAGFAQGYTSGLIAEGDASALTFPDGYPRSFGPHYGYPMGFFAFGRLIGMFFFVGLLVLLIGGIRRMFWCRPWKHAGGSHPAAWKHWRDHPEAHKWGTPPWAKDWKAPEDESAVSEEDEPSQEE